MKKLIFFALICLSLAIPCGANPIPVPPPASMPLEDMHIVIQPCGDTLHATFTGDFTFDYIPIDVLFMLFPVPPDANNIRVWQDDVELPWTWSGQMYPTILSEMPTIPMMVWFGPFPESGAVFRVDYEHNLIKRPEEFIFFYASGTGKYFETYDKTTTAYFDILLPAGFAVAGVWLDNTAHEYEVIDGHLNITVQSYFGPITNDLIVSLVQTPIYVATDGNDTTGDGSPENPFATIQKGIDTAIDGHTVIVQPGTYTGNGNRDIDFFGKAITVRGTDPNDPCVVNTTIIDCNGSESDPHRGFHFQNEEGPNSVVVGLKITNGYNGPGGGILTEYASPKITRCVIKDNQSPHGQGGGICCRWGTPIITHCIISNNSTAPYGFGGGIYSWKSNPTISNCLITNNSSNGYGGGIYCNEAAPIITLCTITGNSALYMGGGICTYNSTSAVNSCIVWDNNAPNGPEIKVRCSIYPTVLYCDVQGGFSGQGNFNSDPCFVAPIADNYHLMINSPCINSGDPCYVPGLNEKDIDGEDRVIAGRVDVGIDEVNIDGPVIGVTPRNLDFTADEGGPNPEPQLLYISNSNIGTGTMNWQINEDCSWLSAIPNSGTSSGEVNEVTVTVDISKANQGLHECELVVTSSEANNSPQIVYVSLYVYGNLPVPSIYPTIQSAIDAALNGDTVLVADGVHTGLGNRDIDFQGKAITVKSENGPENCIIDCNGTYEDNHRGFYFNNGEGRDSVLEGFTITNAYVTVMCEGGAGIYINGASPTISKCIITDNHVRLDPESLCFCFGGGIYIEDGSNLFITDCVISENSVADWGWGGGIYCASSTHATIHNCLINNNTAQGIEGMGGGIYCDDPSVLTVVNCTIVDNLAAQDGGGIYFYTYKPPIRTITNSTIWGNSPDQIYAYDSTKILATYSNIEGGWTGTGNIDTAPCFADPCSGDYHLKSQAGRWDQNTSDWVTDANTSPCIDAGNPGCPLGDEPNDVNNVRINMGAYGGTAEASKSPVNWRSIADLTNDWIVDINDLGVFVNYWLDTGLCIPSDLNRNQFVNFFDYAAFALQWPGTLAAEPGIEYEISPCDMGLSATEQSAQTRFTVTVEGRYIHFEDMMTANCCPDELELQMVVEGNLIIINEIEYLTMPCTCICDYPVTATLGPFEPGTYTLEVYEDYGGFIGSTIVYIE